MLPHPTGTVIVVTFDVIVFQPSFGGVVGNIFILVSPLQPMNIALPRLFTLLGIVILVKLLQLLNVLLPIEVTLFPIVTLVSPLQFSNA